MSDVIKLLPDAVANQIAAGEVIQRPASAVKELLENAIDAGSDHIRLIIKDGGKTLIQVVDNGAGMTESDARLCFERHATSKITRATDLFSIHTMGFRGEALASIAAISKVVLKTRTSDDEVGTQVIVEASALQTQEPCPCQPGTSISVKNLFYNTPARRNFLKSDNVEKRHILTEFQRIAIARPDVSFQFYQNDQLTHQLNKGNLKQRITGLFGSNYNPRLIPVEEETQLLKINGFAAKPEYSKKTRGEQFFFVNKRFIRSPYLNHAVEQAFEELIPEDTFPSFFLFLETDPEQIDVNVHPTKTEIKFQDERFVYQVIKSAVKRSLGKHNVSPTLDFDQESAFDNLPADKNRPVKPPSIQVNPDYNPFQHEKYPSPGGKSLTSRINPRQWEQLFPGADEVREITRQNDGEQTIISPDWEEKKQDNGQKKFFQLHNRFILTPVKSGMMVIDQQRAHERVLFEKYLKSIANKSATSQQLLFPENIHLNEQDTEILKEIIEDIRHLGFEISPSGKCSFVINAVPAGIPEDNSLQECMEGIVENIQKNRLELKNDQQANVVRSLAKRLAVKHGKALTEEEMSTLADSLFACRAPEYSPAGKPVLTIISNDELSDRFK
ncbi:MAG: DNA mismatch repair endonuclease MutL [Bacteroidales bacterium]